MLEDSIRATEEAALDAAETDSVVTGTSFTGNPDGRARGQMIGHGFMGSGDMSRGSEGGSYRVSDPRSSGRSFYADVNSYHLLKQFWMKMCAAS